MDLYDLFKEIKKRPGMFLGHVSIKNLSMFLQGYFFARRDLQIPDTEQELEFYRLDLTIAVIIRVEGDYAPRSL